MTRQKILVVYVTAGAGHRKAAEALYHGLTAARPDDEIVLRDALDDTYPFYKFSYATVYTWMVSHVPWLWRAVFNILDIPALQPLVRLVRRMQNSLHGARFHRYLQQENFDCIFSTHFFPNEVMGYLKRSGKIRARLVGIVTDFDVHRIWLAAGIDVYTGACRYTVEKLQALGVPAERVRDTGIPTLETFGRHEDVGGLRSRLGVQEGVFTVLVATGSFGIGPIEEIIAALDGFQVLVVCGHNRTLYERLRGQEKGLVKIYGLVHNMDELMAVSDVMVTKPGGLSISEALVSGLPMIFFHAIPGQEEHNVRVLREEYGVGISGIGIEAMAGQLRRWRDNPAEFASACERLKAVARPEAVQNLLALTG